MSSSVTLTTWRLACCRPTPWSNWGIRQSSYLAIKSGPTKLITLDIADQWEAGLLRDAAAELGQENWDPGTGLIRGQQIPRDARRTFHPHGARGEAFAEYLRLNPTWKQGTVLPVLVRVHINPVGWARQVIDRRGGTAVRVSRQ